MELQVAVGQILRKAREARGLSQEEFGADAGISRTYVSLIELGSSSATLKMLEKACKWHGLAVSAVIEEAEQMIRNARAANAAHACLPSSDKQDTR